MAINDFLSFGGDPAANVMLQSDYAAASFTPRILGFQTGTALSIQLNKVWRQASLISSMVAQFAVNETGADMLDDGSTSGQATLLTNFTNAVAQVGGAGLTGNYLPLTGGTLTGGLTINAAATQFTINATAGQAASAVMHRGPALAAQFLAYTNNNARWNLVLADSEPETGNNLGSNLQIARYSDAGVFIDFPIQIARQTGIVNFSQPPQFQGGQLPYVPIAGGRMTGTLGSPGIAYAYNSYAHNFQFYWDGTYTHIIVDGVDTGDVATVAWSNTRLGAYLPLTGGTLSGPLQVNSNFGATGTAFFGSTVYFANLGDFSNFTGSGWRYRQWAGSWYDAWNGANGTRLWQTYSGANMQLDSSASLWLSGNLHASGGRIISVAQTTAPSVACWYGPYGCGGMWYATDGLWWGWCDGYGNPTTGEMRLGTDGVLYNWNGIISYNWLQCSQWASVGGTFYANNYAYIIGHTNTHGSQPSVAVVVDGVQGGCMFMGAGYTNGINWGGSDFYGNPLGTCAFSNFNTTFAAGGFYSWSGRDRKENIQPSPDFDSLAALCRIQASEYTAEGVHTLFGLIAEEIEDLLPDAVTREHAGEGAIAIGLMPLIVHLIRAVAQLNERLTVH